MWAYQYISYKGRVISEPMQFEQYIVIADYQKQNRSEVSVLAGDIVEVIEKNENGKKINSWYGLTLRGRLQSCLLNEVEYDTENLSFSNNLDIKFSISYENRM